jgi:hypothetical protein
MKPFHHFPNIENFDCDACQRKFQGKSAYSLAVDWEEFNHYPTFCLNCVRVIEKQNQPKKLDKRTLNKTGRVHLFATRAKKDWIKKLKQLARKEKLKYVEVLERALDYYEKRRKST